jgi:hypothetical protein
MAAKIANYSNPHKFLSQESANPHKFLSQESANPHKSYSSLNDSVIEYASIPDKPDVDKNL